MKGKIFVALFGRNNDFVMTKERLRWLVTKELFCGDEDEKRTNI